MTIAESNALVLEIVKQGNGLAMSVFEGRELASTIRHYSQCAVSFSEINKLCHAVSAVLNKASRKGAVESDLIHDLRKTGQLLWDNLLSRPVKDRLKSTIIRNLLLSLDEELINIPWELLCDGKDFLCLKFNLGRLVRTREQTPAPQYRSIASTLKMLILANPTNDLKSAYLEGLHIKNQFDRRRSEIRIDFKSTQIDTLYVKRNLRDYDIVHFAGHCEYAYDDPKDTGWVLSDGRLTTQDILVLGENLSLPTLVFSNACHSAKVKTDLADFDYQEKTYSLAAAFLFSGVRHYIGTIYKVEDPISLAFAQEFYTELIRGESLGECVRQARLKLIKEYGIAAIAWASYILYGDPNFAMFKSKARPAIFRAKRKFALEKYKKPLLGVGVSVVVISILIYLYMWLPTINPNTYILYLRSQKLFFRGDNQEVISLTNSIIKKDPLFLAVYPLVADTYQRLGDKENALRSYFDYVRYSEKRQDKRNLASAYSGLGWLYYLQGEYSKAFSFYNRALSLSQENKDKLNEAEILGRLAVWYMDNDDNDKALELLTRSSEINRERQYLYKHKYNLACDYFNLGLLFTNKDDYLTAKEFYDKSFRLFEKLRLSHELSDYYFNIGEIYSFRNEYLKAMDSYDKGLKLDLALGNKFNLCSDYNMLGELYLQMEDSTKAQEYFEESIALCKKINALPELADACYNLGLLYKEKNKKNKARDYFRQAQEIYWRINLSKYEKIKQDLLDLD